ncbi:Hsp70 family protein [Catellatospora sichuanensis]|uniref:Hsp70 family protein n=1 Tax=Catellatospora sichuanensis TaxID=1969805 RepID=UPI0011825893|nr:Hsp70 family protein [Catellatospora sichuanensis]
MSYVLGIDLSGTHLSVARSSFADWTWGPPEPVRFGAQAYTVPAVLRVAADGAFTVGDQAAEGPMVDGHRIARGFVQRVGDDVPQIVAGEPCLPHTLTAVLADWAVERAQAQTGQRPEHLAVSHPAAWGEHRRSLLRRALWDIGLGEATLLPAPVAAATAHAWREFGGRTLAVLSMCGNGFETSVVRRTPTGFTMAGCRQGTDPLGGDDFDEALAELVRARLTREFGRGYLQDPQIRLALLDLQSACAKARLTFTTAAQTEVLVPLPLGLTAVPVGRAAFGEAVRPMLLLIVDTLLRTVRAAGLRPDQLDAVLLTGAAAQLPLLAEMIGEQLPGDVAVGADPQPAAAMGAALVAQRRVSGAGQAPRDEPRQHAAEPDPGDDHPTPDGGGTAWHDPAPPRPPVRITDLSLPRSRSSTMFAHARGRVP